MSDARQDAAELRRAFDHSFAVAPAAAIEHEDLLAIRVGGHEHALRLLEITGLHPCPPITRVPSRLAGLAGLGGLRGALIPLFDLRALLGLGEATSPRWLVLVGEPVLGLMFETLEQQLRVPRSALVASSGATTRGFSRTTLATGGEARPVLDLVALHAEIARRARGVSIAKENDR